MQPDQGHHPDYNFILNPAKPAKKGFFSGGGDKKQNLLIKLAVGGVSLLIVIILISVIFGGSSMSTDKLTSLAQQQTELIRVAALGEKQAVSADTKNLASTTRLSLTSAGQETVALVAKEGKKLSAKQLAATQNADTDTLLNQALQTNQFDTTFEQTLRKDLQAYQNNIKTTFDGSKSQSEKALLQKLYAQTQTLLAAIQ
jgi:hypothetical protein